VGYNDDAFEILALKEGLTYADIAKSYGKLNATGSTYEAPALRQVAGHIDRLERGGDVVDIVVAITDGETQAKSESQAQVQRLESLGAKLLAFQFGRGYIVPDVKPQRGEEVPEEAMPFQRPEPSSGQFAEIWGRHGYQVRNPKQVVPAVRDGLRDLLTKG
jgi:hypothetical protein